MLIWMVTGGGVAVTFTAFILYALIAAVITKRSR